MRKSVPQKKYFRNSTETLHLFKRWNIVLKERKIPKQTHKSRVRKYTISRMKALPLKMVPMLVEEGRAIDCSLETIYVSLRLMKG